MFASRFALTSLLALTACVAEVGDEEDFSTEEQGLTGYTALPFDHGWAEGSFSVTPSAVYDVEQGFLGWYGDWVEYPFIGSQQTTVIKTSASGGSDRSGTTHLQWFETQVPATGYFNLSGSLIAKGTTYVKGTGNYFSADHARATVCICVRVYVNGVLTRQSFVWPGKDATKSETRTKSFDKTYNLGSLNSSFYTNAGARVRTEIIVTTHAWTDDSGDSASAALKQLGFLANTSRLRQT